MGQKVHPTGIRLGIVKDWNSRWYANSQDYSVFLHQDLTVRDYIKKKLAHASVSRIQINRPANNAHITIHTARPGIVIGKKAPAPWPCPPCSRRPSAAMWSTSSTPTSPRTPARRTPSPSTPASRRPPSPGARAAPLRVSPVCPVVVPTARGRVRSVTCAARAACSPPPRSGAAGTERSVLTNAVTLSLLPLLPPLYQL